MVLFDFVMWSSGSPMDSRHASTTVPKHWTSSWLWCFGFGLFLYSCWSRELSFWILGSFTRALDFDQFECSAVFVGHHSEHSSACWLESILFRGFGVLDDRVKIWKIMSTTQHCLRKDPLLLSVVHVPWDDKEKGKRSWWIVWFVVVFFAMLWALFVVVWVC